MQFSVGGNSIVQSITNITFHYILSRALGTGAEPGDEELPLKFEEIVDVKTYDKMRPPRPAGQTIIRIMARPQVLCPQELLFSPVCSSKYFIYL